MLASTVKASSAAKVIGAFRVTEAGGVSDTINQFRIENKTALTAVTSDIASVAIYSDGRTLGIIDGADAVACAESTTVTTTEFNAGGSLINFTCSSPIVIGANATQNYLAVITTTVGATNGRTMATRVNAHLVTANAWAVADLSTTNSITIDTTVPTLSIGAPSSSLTATGPVTYLVTYGDPDGGADVGPITLAPGDITLVSTGTATGTVTSVDGPSLGKTIHITGISGNGTLGILSISAATAFDIADNTTLAAGASATFDVDNTAPTVTSVKTGDLTGVGLNKVTVIFSENVDVTLVNGTGWTVTGTDAGSRTVTANTDPAGTSSVMILTLSSPFASENPDATVTYTTGGGLVDNVGTELATGASPNIADGIKPTFVSAIATSDTNIEVTYSEAVTVTDDSSSGSDFTVFLSTSNVDPTKVDLTVSSLGNTAFTSDGLNLANGVVADTSPAHNTITQILSQHVSDGQAPSTPTANPPANTYTSTQSVILSSTDLTNIRYTIDGTDPSTYSSGTLYVGAISVSSSETIKARSCDDAGNISELGTFSYTINSSHGSSGGSVPRVINPLALSGGCKAGDLFSVITGARCNTTISLPSTPSATGVSSYAFGNTLVKLRTRDDYCRAWQHFFNDKFNGHLVTDGICGPLTIATAKAWQASVDLVTDGVLGPLSRAKASMQ